ncbi:MAG: hypothetical protein QOK28_1796 [Actinomycetota bacterium]|jgi:hypothetical protein
MPADDAPDTVTEAVAALAARGYTDELIVRPDGLHATGKDGVEDVRSALVDYVYRFEGPSDPADEAIVLGVHCPTLGVRGVVVSGYGASIDPDHEAVLRELVER